MEAHPLKQLNVQFNIKNVKRGADKTSAPHQVSFFLYTKLWLQTNVKINKFTQTQTETLADREDTEEKEQENYEEQIEAGR